MKKSFVVGLVMLLFASFEVIAGTYYVGNDVSNLLVEQDMHNNSYVFYLKDNTINMIFPDGNIETIFSSEKKLLKFDLYNNYQNFTILTYEEEDQKNFASILLINNDFTVSETYTFDSNLNTEDKISLFWETDGFDIFWINEGILKVISYSFETESFKNKLIETNVTDFWINDNQRNTGYYLSNDKLVFFNFVHENISINISFEDVKKVIRQINYGLHGYLVYKSEEIDFLYEDSEKINSLVIYNEEDFNKIQIIDFICFSYNKCKYLFFYKKQNICFSKLYNGVNCTEYEIGESDKLNVLPNNRTSVLVLSQKDIEKLYVADFENCEIFSKDLPSLDESFEYSGFFYKDESFFCVFSNIENFYVYEISDGNLLLSQSLKNNLKGKDSLDLFSEDFEDLSLPKSFIFQKIIEDNTYIKQSTFLNDKVFCAFYKDKYIYISSINF